MDLQANFANLFASSDKMHGNDFEPFAEVFIYLLKISPGSDRLQIDNNFALAEGMFRLRHANDKRLKELQSLRDEMLGRLPKADPAQPIRQEDGCLIIDARGVYPNLAEAHDALDRYVFLRALEECDGNVTKTSELLGISRNIGHALNRQMQGLPVRASRAANNKPKLKRRRRRT